jgi:hypothetical protein
MPLFEIEGLVLIPRQDVFRSMMLSVAESTRPTTKCFQTSKILFGYVNDLFAVHSGEAELLSNEDHF